MLVVMEDVFTTVRLSTLPVIVPVPLRAPLMFMVKSLPFPAVTLPCRSRSPANPAADVTVIRPLCVVRP